MKKIYFIAGEPSGDLHGAHLVEALKKRDSQLQCRGFGGPKMEKAGVKLDQTIDQLSFMGFTEVVKHLPIIMANFRKAKKAILSWMPDAIVYIDYPGFNMRMARWARKKGFRNFYYIAPQAWAWKEKRALKLKRDIDEMFCILPFEPSFFARFNFEVHYVGHPLVDIIREFKDEYHQNSKTDVELRNLTKPLEVDPAKTGSPEKKILALLPGSRQQEVRKILPVLLEAVCDLDGFQIVIGKSPHVPQAVYDGILEVSRTVNVAFEEKAYQLLYNAHIACVTSGTATLETALFKVPEVVCFRGSMVSYSIAKRLVKVPFISLVNLVMGEEMVSELIQNQLTPDRIRKEVLRLTKESHRHWLDLQYSALEKKLGLGGASEKTAKIIISKMGI